MYLIKRLRLIPPIARMRMTTNITMTYVTSTPRGKHGMRKIAIIKWACHMHTFEINLLCQKH